MMTLVLYDQFLVMSAYLYVTLISIYKVRQLTDLHVMVAVTTVASDRRIEIYAISLSVSPVQVSNN